MGHSKEVTDMLKAQAQAQAQVQAQTQVQPRNEEVNKDVEMELDTPLLTDTTSINEDEPVDGSTVLPPCPFTNQTATAMATVQEQGDTIVR